MRIPGFCSLPIWFRRTVVLGAFSAALVPAIAGAQKVTLEELTSAIVQVKTFIDPDARTLRNLGRERIGSAVAIDDNGLLLTIGYLMVEAHAAEVTTGDGRSVPARVVGYDHETGLGLLQATVPLKVKPLAIGKSGELKERDPVLVASFGGPSRAGPAMIVAQREFAGSWEYLLDRALFTAPPHPVWSGAALINREGKLVGIGSLIVADATGRGDGIAGNMFVPIDLLPPILGDLIAGGRPAGPARPWIGLSANELGNTLVVGQVTAEGPAEKAGLKQGDFIVGVNGAGITGLADFYRKVWALGRAGVTVPLDVRRAGETRRFDVRSMDRLDHLRMRGSL
jgi:S1-C subfamily serine protease